MVLFGEILLLLPYHKSEWCKAYDPTYDFSQYAYALEGGGAGDGSFPTDTNSNATVYENPDYNTDPCRYERLPHLCWLTIEECDISRRMLASVFLGGAIGYERRASDRPAGIRTMGLVSLGSSFFTISSQLAFKSSTMGWDSSRVTAAIPSGVGFLGAGLIFKGTVGVGENEVHQVHGLTTAASVWLSAAVGVGCGGALYFPTVYGTILVLFVLRYGPKLYLLEDSHSIDDEEDDEEDEYSLTEDDSSDNYVKQTNKNDFFRPPNDYVADNGSSPTDSQEAQNLLSNKSKLEKEDASLHNTYDSFRNSSVAKDSNTSTTEKVMLAPNKVVIAKFEDDPLSTIDPTKEEEELQRSLHVGFNESVENIEDADIPQTQLTNAPPSDRKKKKKHNNLKNKPPSFHS